MNIQSNNVISNSVEHPADIQASLKMGQLFDALKEINTSSNSSDLDVLNTFLSRVLFCLYAESTGIFKDNQFTDALVFHTKHDGSDTADFLSDIFIALNNPIGAMQRAGLAKHLDDFAYVNGGLFDRQIGQPLFNADARWALIACGELDWQEISPDIFGSMFQSVINPEQRGGLGQHYTSVSNILRVINPLFMNKLYADLDKSRGNKRKIQTLLHRLSAIKIFDPSCGSCNFLIVAYKELRQFEMCAIDALNQVEAQTVMYHSSISLSQFYGIEIDGFAHKIGVISLWLAEHQMNVAFKERFGYTDPLLPLKHSAVIVHANSLELDWSEVCPNPPLSTGGSEVYVCGNPPFLGFVSRNSSQNDDMKRVFNDFAKHGHMDYVACFFWLGAKYIQNNGELAFVSTNSICQGQQVAMLWPRIFDLGLTISFAYSSFAWSNNAKNNAGVHVVIVALGNSKGVKTIYKPVKGKVNEIAVKNINPYLLEGKSIAVIPRSSPFDDAPIMTNGNVATDGGHLIMNEDEYQRIIAEDPDCNQWIRRYMGGQDFIKNYIRYCLWLPDANMEKINATPSLVKRLEKVSQMRLNSIKKHTQTLAQTPHLFAEIRQPTTGDYIITPYTSSERRDYLPIGFISSQVIVSNSANVIPNATLYDFGLLTSKMHNVWMAAVGSKMKSDYRYSGTLIYNTFPRPIASSKQRQVIESLAKAVLNERGKHKGRTLAYLYDPDKMPSELLEAHKSLDAAIDSLYRKKSFIEDSERLTYLFKQYEKLINEDGEHKR